MPRPTPRPGVPVPAPRPVRPIHLPPGHTIGVNPAVHVRPIRPRRIVPRVRPADRPFTRQNLARAYNNVKRVYATHHEVAWRVNRVKQDYERTYTPLLRQRGERYRRYFDNDDFRYHYHRLWDHGFYGGYWYPVRECDDMPTYFAYPMVYWLYVPVADQDYYEPYYGDDYEQYPVEPFDYANDFYPTDELRDMGIDVSGQSAETQANFRTAMVDFSSALQDLIAQKLGIDFQFSDAQIVIDYYENLQDQALVIEGFVDQDDLHLPFKALLDLVDPSQTALFVPNSDDPSQDDLTTLDYINQRIVDLGGDPYAGEVDSQQTGDLPPAPPTDE